MPAVDLNCDLGEGAGREAELLPLITTANIACGAHAGDETTMRATVDAARRHGVRVGAHPGFADRDHFGRRELSLPPEAIHALVLGQVRRLQEIAAAAGVRVGHVKPHGALYNLAARDPAVAGAVAAAVREAGPGLALFALAGSGSVAAGQAAGLRVVQEVFADRTYRADGSLTPRNLPGALIDDAVVALAQVLEMVRTGRVKTTDGQWVPIVADTVCLHGDGPHAVVFARGLRTALGLAGVTVRPWDA